MANQLPCHTLHFQENFKKRLGVLLNKTSKKSYVLQSETKIFEFRSISPFKVSKLQHWECTSKHSGPVAKLSRCPLSAFLACLESQCRRRRRATHSTQYWSAELSILFWEALSVDVLEPAPTVGHGVNIPKSAADFLVFWRWTSVFCLKISA